MFQWIESCVCCTFDWSFCSWYVLCVSLSLQQEEIQVKGQMIYCPESKALLFLGSPLVDGMDSMTSKGLFLSDIPIHGEYYFNSQGQPNIHTHQWPFLPMFTLMVMAMIWVCWRCCLVWVCVFWCINSQVRSVCVYWMSILKSQPLSALLTKSMILSSFIFSSFLCLLSVKE